jgi:hypothetical protein
MIMASTEARGKSTDSSKQSNFSMVAFYALNGPHKRKDRESMKKSMKVSALLVSTLILSTIGFVQNSYGVQTSTIQVIPNQVVNFGSTLTGGTSDGWSSRPDSGGTWSQGKVAKLHFALKGSYPKGILLKVLASGFVNVKNPTVTVNVLANGMHLGDLKFSSKSNGGLFPLAITNNLLLKGKGKVDLEFQIQNSASPKKLGLSSDVRNLGLFLISIAFIPSI